jgi:hypothetical protein
MSYFKQTLLEAIEKCKTYDDHGGNEHEVNRVIELIHQFYHQLDTLIINEREQVGLANINHASGNNNIIKRIKGATVIVQETVEM